jgi:hypothetical protein
MTFSLILGRIDLRGFCLFIPQITLYDYRQKNPLKCYTLLSHAIFFVKFHYFFTRDD